MISLLLFQALELIQPEVKTAVILLWFLKLISPMGFLEWWISHVCRGRHIGLPGFFRPSGPQCWASNYVESSNRGSGRNAVGFHPAIVLVPGKKNFPPLAALA